MIRSRPFSSFFSFCWVDFGSPGNRLIEFAYVMFILARFLPLPLFRLVRGFA